MITLFRTEKRYGLDEIKDAVAKQIQKLPQMISTIGTSTKIFRYEFPCENLDILAWLHNQAIDSKFYWSDRENAFEIGGVGTADCLTSSEKFGYEKILNDIEDRLSADNPRLRYYGGFSFHKPAAGKKWDSFGHHFFLVPEFEIYKKHKEILFAFNVALKNISEENIQKTVNTLQSIDFSTETSYRKVPQIKVRRDYPSHEEWKTLFDKVLADKTRQGIEKIVLARQSVFEFDVNIRPSALIKHLKNQTPGCYHFCLQTQNYNAFLGATPERLFRRQGQIIESEALAGTAQRGKNEDEELAMEHDLIHSPKTKLEHHFVVEAIKKSLGNLCSGIKFEQDSSILKLKEGQHLITRFKGHLKSSVTNDQILTQLHPTPAVAGSPREASIQMIERLEPFERGWYAAPIGYVGYDEVEFAVGIRSGLVHDNTLSLYAGAGIVDGSQANAEWNEIESKISRFMKVFTP